MAVCVWCGREHKGEADRDGEGGRLYCGSRRSRCAPRAVADAADALLRSPVAPRRFETLRKKNTQKTEKKPRQAVQTFTETRPRFHPP